MPMGVPMELEDEETWLCGRIIRLRMALRLTSDPRTDATADDEERPENLQRSEYWKRPRRSALLEQGV